MKKHIFIFYTLLLLSCVSTPQPTSKSKLPRSNKWLNPQGETFAINQKWWKAFGDETLNSLIKKAIQQNISLQIAVQRSKLAATSLAEAKLKRVPGASVSLSKESSVSEANSTQKTFKASASLSWESDLWGKFSKMSSANLAEYKATEADWRASYLKLIKDITINYISLRQYDEQRSLLEKALGYSSDLKKIHQLLFEKGVEDKVNYSLEKAENLRIQSEIIEVERARKVILNQIAILVAEPEGVQIPPRKLTSSLKPLDFPKDITANLLERRPDVIAAELRVQKDFLMSESTRAARLPTITLGLSGSLANESISLLTQGWAAAIIPKISFPALDPQTKINVEKQDINLAITKKQYEETIVKAISEVEIALTNRQAHVKRMVLERSRLKELTDADEKNALSFKAGVISSLERIQFQQQLISAEQQILNFYSQELQDTVTLFTALGGGWDY